MEAYELADGLVQDIHDQSKRLLDLFLGRGHIYDFVKPEQVTKQLESMASRLPSTIQVWPSPVLKTTVEQNNSHIMVYGHFLISEEATYTLLKVTPTPLKMSGEFYWTMELTNNFLAIEYNQQLYYELKEDEVMSSLQMDHHVFITTPTIVRNIEHNPSCTIDYLYDRKHTSKCSIVKRPLGAIVWKQLYMANTWLFITKEETLIAITCQGHRQEIQLKASGILQVDGGCTIRTGQNIINPVIQTRIPVLSTAIKVLDVNMTESRITEEMTDIQLVTEPIIKLTGQNAISPMDESIADITWSRISHHTASTSILTTTAWVVALITMVWTIKAIWRCWTNYRDNHQAKRKPRPKKRTRHHQTTQYTAEETQFQMRELRASEPCLSSLAGQNVQKSEA